MSDGYLYAVYRKGELLDVKTTEWEAKSYIDDNIDRGRIDHVEQRAAYEIRVFADTGERL